jgi:hypothetical protein
VSLDFIAPVQLTAASVHSCFRAGDPVAPIAVINLRALAWTEPAGLVAIAMFAESQSQIGRLPRLYAPADVNRARYLSRMGVGEIVSSLGGAHDLPATRLWDQEGYLLELQRFDGEDAPPELARLVEARLVDGPSAEAVHKGICEIGANVPDHSGRAHGYVAAVTTHGASRVAFAIGDAGVGLLEPLARRGYASNAEVIRDLFARGGVSRLGAEGRGRGVHRTREVVTKGGGSVYMASGRDAVSSTGSITHAASGAIAIPGTLLQGSMPC